MAGDTAPPRPADLPPGYDEDDPYSGEDLSSYPEWWRENIEVFRAHEMRPYRPPRFVDGEVTTEVIDRLEAELDVRVQLRAFDPQSDGDWQVWVDGDPVATVARTRTQGGNSRYELTAAAFEGIVRDAVEPGATGYRP